MSSARVGFCKAQACSPRWRSPPTPRRRWNANGACSRCFFVKGEDAAAALDAEAEDDVLALTPALDLRELIEDELLLALPLVPRHAHCPEPLPRAFVEDPAVDPADNPFAALAVLKGGLRPN